MFLGSKPHAISCNDNPQTTRAAPPSNIEALPAQQPLVSLPGSSFQGGSKFVNQTIKATIAQGPGLVERKIQQETIGLIPKGLNVDIFIYIGIFPIIYI